jgi:hypothetical protein
MTVIFDDLDDGMRGGQRYRAVDDALMHAREKWRPRVEGRIAALAKK